MGLPAIQADYLFVGPLLAARLRDQVGDIAVDVVETAEQVLAADKRASVLLVMWAGDAFGDRAAKRGQIVTQRWLVILALNNASATPDARQLKAGPLMSKAHRAVVGWTPAGAVNSFVRAPAPMRPDINKTKALYPLGFEIDLSL